MQNKFSVIFYSAIILTLALAALKLFKVVSIGWLAVAVPILAILGLIMLGFIAVVAIVLIHKFYFPYKNQNEKTKSDERVL